MKKLLFKFYLNRLLKQVKRNKDNYYFPPDYHTMLTKRKIKTSLLGSILMIITAGLGAVPIFFFFYTDIFEEESCLFRNYTLCSLIYFHNLSLTSGTDVIKIKDAETQFQSY